MKLSARYVEENRDAGTFRVHRDAFLSQDVLEAEKTEFFDKVWLYLGHESELSKPGDFIARQVGGRPIIFTRDKTGEIRALLNTCRHRGAQVCREDFGNAKIFTCFYHGWAYDNTGALVNVPDGDSYQSLDRSTHGLLTPPKVDSHSGFWFLSYNPDVEPLSDYLADAKELLDLVANQSETGMAVVKGAHHYSMKANWKLLMENSCDGYHGMSVHQTYVEMMMSMGMTPSLVTQKRDGTSLIPDFGIDLGNGHATTWFPELGRPLMNERSRELVAAHRARMVERFGEEYTRRALNTSRNTIVFPNLVIVDLNFGIQIRTMFPVSPTETAITGWQISPAEIGEELKGYRIDNALTFWGPGGLATPDDVEALEQCQLGFAAAKEVPWSDISKGFGKDRPTTFDELQMRAFWRQWNRFVTGEDLPGEGESYAALMDRIAEKVGSA
ncbi:aromatic ring-hydroxylating oxygenase subunit alpha [Sporichthya polymorpha]|uniref:aromatic ring-hydroxylating oxygenase subunit alpha n=1 Tax=Sporichthya polymorpha TaxID=35751 RepID=UPI00037B0378|nr:aromatic ring-hydroxylating dioxygenase subunit alpha [Sporichthya polymorpha]